MKIPARVNWILPSDGGRSAVPDCLRYVTLSRFTEDSPNWPDGAWSVVLEFERSPVEQGHVSMGVASFLMEAAPNDRLQPGRSFELFEGRKRVAVVELFGAPKPEDGNL